MVDSVGGLFVDAEARGLDQFTRDFDRAAVAIGRAETQLEQYNDQLERLRRNQRTAGNNPSGSNNFSGGGGGGGISGNGGFGAGGAGLALAASGALAGGAVASGGVATTGYIARLDASVARLGTLRTELTRLEGLNTSAFSTIELGQHNSEINRTKRNITDLQRSTEGYTGAAQQADRTTRRFGAGAVISTAAIIALGVAISGVATRASSENLMASRSLSQVNTLLEGNAESYNRIAQLALEHVRLYGGDLPTIINSYYQSFSAGSGGYVKAQEEVTTATMLSVVAIGSQEQSLRAVTSLTNTYGLQNLSTARTADLLTLAVNRGELTLGTIGGQLGNVAPLFQAANIPAEALLGSFVALSLVGIQPDRATTGLRAIVNSVTSATDAAKEFARQNDIAFSVSGLSDFPNFLDGIRSRIRSLDTDSQFAFLRNLFPNQEALNVIIPLLGEGFNSLTDFIDSASESTGLLRNRFDQLSQELSQRHAVNVGKIDAAYFLLGQNVNNFLVPALGTYANVLTFAAGNLDLLAIGVASVVGFALPALARALWALVIPTSILSFGINILSAAVIGFGAAALIGRGALDGLLAGTSQLDLATVDLLNTQKTYTAGAQALDETDRGRVATQLALSETYLRQATLVRDLTIEEKRLEDERRASGNGTLDADQYEDLEIAVRNYTQLVIEAGDENERLRGIFNTLVAQLGSYSAATATATDATDTLGASVTNLASIFEENLVRAIRSASDAFAEFALDGGRSLRSLQQSFSETARRFGEGVIGDTIANAFNPTNFLSPAPNSGNLQPNAGNFATPGSAANVFSQQSFANRAANFAAPTSGFFGGGGVLGTGLGAGSSFLGAISAAVPPLLAFTAAVSVIPQIIGRQTRTGFNVNAGVGGINSLEATTRESGLSGFFRLLRTGSRNGVADATSLEDFQLRRSFEPVIRQVQEIAEISGRTFRDVVVHGATAEEAARNYGEAIAGQVGGLTRFQMAGQSLITTLDVLVRSARNLDDQYRSVGLGNSGYGRNDSLDLFATGLLNEAGGPGNLASLNTLRPEQTIIAISQRELERVLGRGSNAITDPEALVSLISAQTSELSFRGRVAQTSLDIYQRRLDSIINADGSPRRGFTDASVLAARNELARERREQEDILNPIIERLRALTSVIDDFNVVNPDAAINDPDDPRVNNNRIRLGNEQFRDEAERRIAETTLQNTIGMELDERRNAILDSILAKLPDPNGGDVVEGLRDQRIIDARTATMGELQQ